MATPKTPRKRADKPNRDTPADAPEMAPETSPETAAEMSAPDSTWVEDGSDAVAAAPEPAEDEVTVLGEPVIEDPTPEAAAEDAAIMDEPVTEAKTNPPEPTAPEAIVASPTVVKSGPGFVPLVLGGVVAAGLGFALARYVVPEGWPVPGASPLQTQLTQQAEDIDGLRAQLQAMPQNDGGKAVLDELGSVRETAASALEAAEAAKLAAANMPSAGPGEDFAPRIAAIEDRLSALESSPAAQGSAVDPAVLSRLTTEIDALRSGLEAQKAASEALVSEAEAVRAEAATKAQTVLLQAALTKVEAAMQNGAPFAEPLALLVNSGVAVPAILTERAETGVPTMAALAASFDEPARAALEESLRGNMGSTWPERVGSFLRAQTGARSLTPKNGSDPDAILSRANAAVVAGDLATAITEISTLPEPAQAALSGWVEQAKLRLDAQAATVALATALSER